MSVGTVTYRERIADLTGYDCADPHQRFIVSAPGAAQRLSSQGSSGKSHDQEDIGDRRNHPLTVVGVPAGPVERGPLTATGQSVNQRTGSSVRHDSSEAQGSPPGSDVS